MDSGKESDMVSNRTQLAFVAVALFCLALAASTGALLRFELTGQIVPWAQNLTAVRHAHSHLMYFGWVTLALMVFIWADLPRWTGRDLPRSVPWQLAATAAAALLSYPAFWANGYGLTQVGSKQLPLGSMAASINGLTWFFFVGLYVRATWRLPRRRLPVRLWDWAIVLMLAASLGAVGLVAVVFSHQSDLFWRDLFLHQFLDLFGAGWFTLALLGVLWSHLGDDLPARWLPVASLALLLMPTFVLGMPPHEVPPLLFWIAALANGAAAALLGIHLAGLWRARDRLPRLGWLALAALAAAIGTAFLLLIPGLWAWSGDGQLRIFYLHLVLLVWVSTLLVALIEERWSLLPGRWQTAVNTLWVVGVVGMVGSLLAAGFGEFLPVKPGVWLTLAAWFSVPAAVAALALCVAGLTALVRSSQLAERKARVQPS